MSAVLQAHDVSVAFGGVQALSGVDFALDRGSLAGLLGPNGAGKTTLLNVLSGVLRPTSGRVTFDEKDHTRSTSRSRARAGMRRTFQSCRLVPQLTVMDNVVLASDWSRRSAREAKARAEALLTEAGLDGRGSVKATELPFGVQRRVEIVRALLPGPSVLLLDEPAGGLSREEADELGDWLTSIASRGVGLVLVEHNVRMVQRICSNVTVLAQGRVIFDGPPGDMSGSRAVVESYLGSSW